MPSIEVSQSAFDYLKSIAVPLVDTTISVFDRVISEHRMHRPTAVGAVGGMEVQFGPKDLPSVKFTSIEAATIDGHSASKTNWNTILEDTIAACVAKGVSSSDVKQSLFAQVIDGNQQSRNGFRFIRTAGFSFQGLEAERACKNIVLLAVKFDISVEITVRWQENEEAQFPGQRARLSFP